MYVDRHGSLCWLGNSKAAVLPRWLTVAEQQELHVHPRDLKPLGKAWHVSGPSAKALYARYCAYRQYRDQHKIVSRIYRGDTLVVTTAPELRVSEIEVVLAEN